MMPWLISTKPIAMVMKIVTQDNFVHFQTMVSEDPLSKIKMESVCLKEKKMSSVTMGQTMLVKITLAAYTRMFAKSMDL